MAAEGFTALAHEELSALVEAAPVALLAVDAHGRVRLINRAAAQLCGTGPEAALGRPLVEVAPALAEARAGAVQLAGASVVCDEASARGLRVLALRVVGEARPPALRPGRVLIADDNLVSRRVAAALLAKLGLTCEVVGDGREALARLEREPFDVVLMDCRMPVLDGLATTREIRSMAEPRRSQPIVALTSSGLREDRERCLAAGMNEVVLKPFALEAVVPVLARWLAAAPEVDEAALAELTAELGRDEVVGLVERLIGQVFGVLSELRAAEATGDLAAAGAAAHGLRGAAGTLGARGLAAGLLELERVCRWPAPTRLSAAVRGVEAASARAVAALRAWADRGAWTG